MQKVAAVKVGSYDYNYEDVEKGIQEVLTLLGGLDKFRRKSIMMTCWSIMLN